MNDLKEKIKQFWMSKVKIDDAGIGTVELILILVVLIGLVAVFKTQITGIVNSIFEKIISGSNSI